MTLENSTVGIVGMGLMGGAIAMALRGPCGVAQDRLFACDIDGNALIQAREAGLVSQTWSSDAAGEMLNLCDLVFLCLGPAALVKFLDTWEQSFKPGSLVTDIAGVKGSVVTRAEKLRSDIEFIPGHPMAGAEGGGFAAASRCSFTGKNYILTPLSRNKPGNIDFLKTLIHRMGFDRITETTALDHDRNVAFTSQLCHIIAAALIDCENDTAISRFGGGSFEDLTRIALFNAPLWAELFSTNREALFERIEQFESSLDEIKALIRDNEKIAELEQRLTQVRERRAAMNSRD
jgi:prephenate dehydrogenase